MQKSPDAFRTISEVADWIDTPAHVLRFWESRFTQIKPIKRAGGRRYYRPADMALLGGIKKLLHEDGMTIRGVQKLLREHGVKHVAALAPPIDGYDPEPVEPLGDSMPVPPAPMAEDVPQAQDVVGASDNAAETPPESTVVAFTPAQTPPAQVDPTPKPVAPEAAPLPTASTPAAPTTPSDDAAGMTPNLFDLPETDLPETEQDVAPQTEAAPTDTEATPTDLALSNAAPTNNEPLSAIKTALEKADPTHVDHPEELLNKPHATLDTPPTAPIEAPEGDTLGDTAPEMNTETGPAIEGDLDESNTPAFLRSPLGEAPVADVLDPIDTAPHAPTLDAPHMDAPTDLPQTTPEAGDTMAPAPSFDDVQPVAQSVAAQPDETLPVDPVETVQTPDAAPVSAIPQLDLPDDPAVDPSVGVGETNALPPSNGAARSVEQLAKIPPETLKSLISRVESLISTVS